MTLTLTGNGSASTTTDAAGIYTLSSVAAGGSYTVTPTKANRAPGSAGINTLDVIAVQRHFLGTALIPPGCRLTAANVNGGSINTLDVIAIQRFFLGQTFGTANVGKYQFSPAHRIYLGPSVNQTAQNYDALIFGDVVNPFISPPRPGGPAPEANVDESSANEVPATVAAVALPNVAVTSTASFIAAVATSAIEAKNNLIGFQGDFTFDSTVLSFESPPVQPAGLTGVNWNVSGNVLPGTGPIRTLRISAFSLDLAPLSGSGTLFELRIARIRKADQITQLLWAEPPDHFIFIDADLNTQKPGYTGPGSVSSRQR